MNTKKLRALIVFFLLTGWLIHPLRHEEPPGLEPGVLLGVTQWIN